MPQEHSVISLTVQGGFTTALAVLALACASSIPANSQDLDWDFYAGAFAGYNMQSGKIGMTGDAATGQSFIDVGVIPSFIQMEGQSPEAGVELGFNWSPAGSPLLIGVEADFSGLDLSGEQSLVAHYEDPDEDTEIDSETSLSYALKDLGTLRARLGYYSAYDKFLLYSTFGLAAGRATLAFNSDISGTINGSRLVDYHIENETKDVKVGWAVGAGFEYGVFGNWAIKAEYLYYDLGKQTNFATDLNNPASLTQTASITGQTVRLGIIYKFN